MMLQRLVRGLCVVWCLVWCVVASVGAAAAQTITVGSKNFGESYLLAEIAAQVLEAQGFRVNRKLGLGGTLICYEALRNAEIDLYPEYTGTLSQAVLTDSDATLAHRRALATRPTALALGSVLFPVGFGLWLGWAAGRADNGPIIPGPGLYGWACHRCT